MEGQPRHRLLDGSEARISYYEWGEPGNTPVLLIHATGFHARVWDATVEALPEGFHVIAVDLRGHGLSEKKGLLGDWRIVATDVGDLVRHLGLRDAVGVGHSMGGHCLTQLAISMPERWQRLLLIDPVMVDPAIYDAYAGQPPADPAQHPVARRRNEWRNWEEMFERFRDRHPYSLWQPRVLADYCRYGLVPAASGEGFELACPPLVEASVYSGHGGVCLYGELDKVEVPVTVLRAMGPEAGHVPGTDFAISPTWPGLAGLFPNGRDVHLAHLSHFIPMQDPALTARWIADPETAPAA